MSIMAAKSLPYQRSSRLEYHWLFLSHIRQCYEAGLDSTVFLQPVLGLPSARDGYLDSTENRVILLTDAQRETFVLCCAIHATSSLIFCYTSSAGDTLLYWLVIGLYLHKSTRLISKDTRGSQMLSQIRQHYCNMKLYGTAARNHL